MTYQAVHTPRYPFRDGLEPAITEISHPKLDGFNRRPGRQEGRSLHRSRSVKTAATRGTVSPWLIVTALVVFPARIVLWLLVLTLLVCAALGTWPGPDPVGRRAASFEEPYRYTDGLAVTVAGINHGTLAQIPYTDDPSVQPGDPYTIITVTLRNDSRHTFEAWFVGRVTYGPHRRPAGRFATRSLDDQASVQLIPPAVTSDPYSLGFLIPTNTHDDVELELTIDSGAHRTAVFAGTLKILPRTIH